MVLLKNKNFYRYIYESNDGYAIKKDNEHYGWYDDVRWALYDRDMLEQVDWDMSVFVELPEYPNPYLHMKLPEFKKSFEYITHVPERFIVRKWINGKNIHFGSYKTLEEAIKRKEELDKNGWVK